MAVFAWDNGPLLKLLLHAAKYPSASINGLLLGTIAAGEPPQSAAGSPPGSPRAPVAQRRIHVLDVVPLFHSYLTFAMPLETALVQVDAYAAERKLQVVGVYHASERLSDAALSPVAARIAEKLQQRCCPQSAVFIVDNQQLGQYLQGDATTFMQLYVQAEGRGSWQAATAATGKVEYGAGDVPRLYVQNVGEGKHRQLADFGEHLEDLSRDWTNRDLGL